MGVPSLSPCSASVCCPHPFTWDLRRHSFYTVGVRTPRAAAPASGAAPNISWRGGTNCLSQSVYRWPFKSSLLLSQLADSKSWNFSRALPGKTATTSIVVWSYHFVLLWSTFYPLSICYKSSKMSCPRMVLSSSQGPHVFPLFSYILSHFPGIYSALGLQVGRRQTRSLFSWGLWSWVAEQTTHGISTVLQEGFPDQVRKGLQRKRVFKLRSEGWSGFLLVQEEGCGQNRKEGGTAL